MGRRGCGCICIGGGSGWLLLRRRLVPVWPVILVRCIGGGGGWRGRTGGRGRVCFDGEERQAGDFEISGYGKGKASVGDERDGQGIGAGRAGGGDLAWFGVLAVAIGIEIAGAGAAAADAGPFTDVHVFVVGIGDVGAVAVLVPVIQPIEGHGEGDLGTFIEYRRHAVDFDGGRRQRFGCVRWRGRVGRGRRRGGRMRFSRSGGGCGRMRFGGGRRCGQRGIDGNAAVTGERDLLG